MRRFVSLALLATLPLCGCPEATPTEQPASEGTDPAGASAASDLPEWKRAYAPTDDAWKSVPQVFTFNNGAEPETLDVHKMTGVPEGRIAGGLFEGLVTSDPKTLEPRPGVAERWEVSADQKVYTFHLRADAKWSDGRPVTAEDFRASWERALTPATGCQYAYMFFPIAGAQAFQQGELTDFAQVGVKVKDERTLEVTLAAPCPYFLDLVAFHTLMPVPMWAVEQHGDAWPRPENIACNGPFKLIEWSSGQQIVMVPNEHYWDREFVKLEKIVALPYEDVETSYKLFIQGENDWMTTVPAAKIDEVKRNPAYYAQPYLGSYFYRINVTKPPFDDVRVRKAFSIGFDREVITRDILKAGQIPATYFTPPMPRYQPPEGLAFDPEQARKLLAEAGYGPGGAPFPTVELLYNTLEDHKRVAEAIVQQWKENLGITVSLRNTEWKVYLSDVEQLNYNIARAGWIGDYVDPNTFLDLWVTGGGNNNTGWSSATYDELITKAASEADPAARTELLQQAETILIKDELPIIPVYIYVNQGMLADKVQGWYENVRDLHPLQYLWIEPTE